MCLLMGEGMACGSLPFPGTGCPIPDVDYLCLLCIDFMFGMLFPILTTFLGCFVHGFCFSINGLNMLPWASFTCCTKDNQQGCFRLSNWFSSLAACGAVDEPLASCMIVHFSAHISKWELVCKFGVIFHIFIISCLCSRFHVWNQWFFFTL